jgi:hypothetical protein
MNLFQFMSDSPVLTFFILLIIVGGIVDVIKAAKNKGGK